MTALCSDYDGSAVIGTKDGQPFWIEQPERCHVSAEVMASSSGAAFILAAYEVSDGCRSDVLHARRLPAEVTR